MTGSDAGIDGTPEDLPRRPLPQWEDQKRLRHPQAGDEAAVEQALAGLGARLVRERTDRGVTLEVLARRTGVSASTLSRLESGRRRPTLELLLRIALAYGLTLDELVGLPGYAGFAAPAETVRHGGDRVVWRLTRSEVTPTPYKLVYAATESEPPEDLAVHHGSMWVFVIAGRLRVLVDGDEQILAPGQAVDIDTTRPHWTGSTGEGPVEVLALVSDRASRPDQALPGP